MGQYTKQDDVQSNCINVWRQMYLIVTPGAYILDGSMRIPPTLSDRYLMNITAPKESTPIDAKELDAGGLLPLT